PASLHSRWHLQEIADDSLVLMRVKLDRAKIEMRVELSPGTWIVEPHKAQLQQVLLNLLLNSIQAMTVGGDIVLRIGPPADAQAEFVAIELTDTGSGIPQDIRGRIFDSFLSGRPGGTGLGLAIAKRILLSHHGDIVLVSTGPTGTT